MEMGAIEGHAVRLGSARWLFHPGKCVRVMSAAVWSYPEATPSEAIDRWETSLEAVLIPDAEVRHCKGGCGVQLKAGARSSYVYGHANGCPVSFDQEIADNFEHVNGDSPKSSGRV